MQSELSAWAAVIYFLRVETEFILDDKGTGATSLTAGPHLSPLRVCARAPQCLNWRAEGKSNYFGGQEFTFSSSKTRVIRPTTGCGKWGHPHICADLLPEAVWLHTAMGVYGSLMRSRWEWDIRIPRILKNATPQIRAHGRLRCLTWPIKH